MAGAPTAILVENPDGMPDDSIISIRFGATRRQAPLETVKVHPLKFPAAEDACCEPLKIDVLQPIASARLVLHPNECHYRLGLDTKEKGVMAIGLNIQGIDKFASNNTGGQMPLAQPSVKAKYQDAATSAREYLESHGLLRYVQALLHAIIQVRPKDPYKFMVDQLMAPRCAGADRPTTPWTATHDEASLRDIATALGQSFPPTSSPLAPGAHSSKVGLSDPSPPQMPPAPAPPPPQEAPTALPCRVGDAALNDRAKLEEDRLRMKEMLVTATASGSLSKTLAEMSPTARAQAPDDALRKRLKATLANGCTSGMLEKALAEIPKDGQSGTKEKTDRMRIRAFDALVESTNSGTLAQAVRSVSPEWPHDKKKESSSVAPKQDANDKKKETLEELRTQMGGLLVTASDSGQLKEALAKVVSNNRAQQDNEVGLMPKEPNGKKKESFDELRLQMRGLLEAACDSGQLKEAFVKVGSKTSRAQQDNSVGLMPTEPNDVKKESFGELQIRMRGLLEAASDSGQLKEALANAGSKTSIAQQDNSVGLMPTEPNDVKKESFDELRIQMRGLLEAASDSGQLKEALVKVGSKTSKAQQDNDLDLMRRQMKNYLEAAYDTGDLHHALRSFAPMEANDKKRESVHELRIQMRGLLEAASDSGQLKEALAKAESRTSKARQDNDVDLVRSKMRNAFAASCDSGELDKALQSASLLQIRSVLVEAIDSGALARTLLETSCESGQLGNAIATIPQETNSSSKDSQEAMRVKLKNLLETSCASGKLQSVVQTMPKAGDLANLKLILRKQLAAASANGLLQSRVENLKNEQCIRGQPEDFGQALQKAGRVEEIPSALEVKDKMRKLLQSAYASGQLGPALHSAFSRAVPTESSKALIPSLAPDSKVSLPLPTEPPRAVDNQALPPSVPGSKVGTCDVSVTDLKLRMRDMLETKCASGELAGALVTMHRAKQEAQLRNLNVSVQGAVETAVSSGDRDTTLETLSSHMAHFPQEAEMEAPLPLSPTPTLVANQFAPAPFPGAAPPPPLVPLSHESLPGSSRPPTGLRRPMSAVARSALAPTLQQAEEKRQRPLSAGSSQRLECLSQNIFEVQRNQETLHRVVSDLAVQMETLAKENRSLNDKLHKRGDPSNS